LIYFNIRALKLPLKEPWPGPTGKVNSHCFEEGGFYFSTKILIM
jgi:hypothetical protein